MEIEIRLASEKDVLGWDHFIEASPYSTIFHTWEWLKIAEKYSTSSILGKHSKCKLYPLMGFKGDEIVAVLPMFQYTYLIYHLLASPPARVEVPYLGPIIKDYDKLKQSKQEYLFSNFMKNVNGFISSKLRPLYTSIISSPNLFDSRPLSWNGYEITPRYTYEIPLSSDLETIKNSFTKDIRQKLNKAQAAGVEVIIDNNGVDNIYNLLYQRRTEQGEIQRSSKDYVREIATQFSQKNLKILIASHKGETIGGLMALIHKDKVQVWFGTPKPQMDGVNELLIWELIIWSKENGYKRFENIGADSPELAEFKSKFNPNVVPYFLARRYNSRIIKLIGHLM